MVYKTSSHLTYILIKFVNFLTHLDISYSSKKVLKGTPLKIVALKFTIALFCVCVVCRFSSGQFLLIPCQPLTSLSWKVKGMMNSLKTLWHAKTKLLYFYLQFFKAIANLGRGLQNVCLKHYLDKKIIQHGA